MDGGSITVSASVFASISDGSAGASPSRVYRTGGRGSRRAVAVILLTKLFLLLHDAPASTNSAPARLADLESKLTAMGIEIDEGAASRASRLAVIQTIDPGARVITSNEWNTIREQRAGFAYHPGFSLTMSNGLPLISWIQPGSPADRAGLKPGDVLAGAGTNQFGKVSLPRIRGNFISATPATTTVALVRDKITNMIEVALEKMPLPTIEAQERLHNGFGYIKPAGLFPGTGADVARILREWADARHAGVILDLRNTAGGDEDSIRTIAGLFVSDGQFLYAHRDHESRDLDVVKSTEASPLSMPVMVLIDRNTSGAAEILAAILQATSSTALLIGEATTGEFLLREPVEFDDESILMATRVLDTADGTRFNGKFGVVPAVSISESEQFTHDYDPPLNLMDRRQRLEIESHDAALRLRVRGDGTLERAVDLLVSLKSLQKTHDTVSSPQP